MTHSSGEQAWEPLQVVRVPNSKLAREVTELVRDTESPPLSHHSSRVFHWGFPTRARHSLSDGVRSGSMSDGTDILRRRLGGRAWRTGATAAGTPRVGLPQTTDPVARSLARLQ
jgi:hypothetical protein